MKSKVKTILSAILLTVIMVFPALAQELEDYNENDYNKLVAFALQGDNLSKLGWDLDNPQSWDYVDWDESDGNNIRLLKFSLYGTGIVLSGEADFSNCEKLELLDLTADNSEEEDLKITSINVSGCINLEDLYCSEHQLTELDLSGLTNLINLECYENQLTELDLSGLTNLTGVYCYDNQLTELNITGLTLWNLHVYGNYISGKDKIIGYNDNWNDVALNFDEFDEEGNYNFIFDNQRVSCSDGEHVFGNLQIIKAATCTAVGRSKRECEICGWTEFEDIPMSAHDFSLSGEEFSPATCGAPQMLRGKCSLCGIESEEEKDLKIGMPALDNCIEINEENFPANQFRDAVLSWEEHHGNDDGFLSDDEIAKYTNLEIGFFENWGDIGKDLTGIKYLTSLESLLISGEPAEIDVSGMTSLKTLDCNQTNNLTSINVSGCVNLKGLSCSYNRLTELDVSGLENLQYLYCDNNRLTELDISGLTNLEELRCYNNQLTKLDVSNCVNLEVLYCGNNQLTELGLSGLENLQYFDCSDNQITELNVLGLRNLVDLECGNNQLTELDVTGLSLEYLLVFKNYMSGKDKVIGFDVNSWSDFVWESEDDFLEINWEEDFFIFDNQRVSCEDGEHIWGELQTITPETCTTDGKNKFVCSVCGKVEIEVIPAKHIWGDWTNVVEATCVSKATHDRVCTRDGCEVKQLAVEFGEALGHTLEEVTAIPATCTTEGRTAGEKCTREGCSHNTSTVISILTEGCDDKTPIIYTEATGKALFKSNIVSDKMEIVLKGKVSFVVYDMTGNVVADGNGKIWDLRNSAGRFVANGSYLVVVEATDRNGVKERWSDKLGVKR